jgi:hypothetical protein
VPAGKTLYLISVHVASGKGGNTTNLNTVIFTPKAREFGDNVFISRGELFTINSAIVRPLNMSDKFIEKTDIKMSVQGDYVSGSSVYVASLRGGIEINS